jgi:hypothetical protein
MAAPAIIKPGPIKVRGLQLKAGAAGKSLTCQGGMQPAETVSGDLAMPGVAAGGEDCDIDAFSVQVGCRSV